jgi:hypothetical protein
MTYTKAKFWAALSVGFVAAVIKFIAAYWEVDLGEHEAEIAEIVARFVEDLVTGGVVAAAVYQVPNKAE